MSLCLPCHWAEQHMYTRTHLHSCTHACRHTQKQSLLSCSSVALAGRKKKSHSNQTVNTATLFTTHLGIYPDTQGTVCLLQSWILYVFLWFWSSDECIYGDAVAQGLLSAGRVETTDESKKERIKNRGIEEVNSSYTGHISHRHTASVHPARILMLKKKPLRSLFTCPSTCPHFLLQRTEDGPINTDSYMCCFLHHIHLGQLKNWTLAGQVGDSSFLEKKMKFHLKM